MVDNRWRASCACFVCIFPAGKVIKVREGEGVAPVAAGGRMINCLACVSVQEKCGE